MAKHRHKKAYREAAFVAALEAGLKGKRMESATVRCEFFHKTMNFLDGDNALASLKCAFDGLVDAGVFTDDKDLTHLPVVQSKDAKNPRVEIHITATEA